jgi:hypothetical protein
MAHIFASLFFVMISAGCVALLAATLWEGRSVVLRALGIEMRIEREAVIGRRQVRIRSAGRWQMADRPISAKAMPSRAAA